MAFLTILDVIFTKKEKMAGINLIFIETKPKWPKIGKFQKIVINITANQKEGQNWSLRPLSEQLRDF